MTGDKSRQGIAPVVIALPLPLAMLARLSTAAVLGTLVATGADCVTRSAYKTATSAPPVSRSFYVPDAGKTQVHYHPLQFQNAQFTFGEQGNRLWADSELLEFTLKRDDTNHLQRFTLTLQPEPVRYSSGEPGAQAMRLETPTTTYEDMNGDSILDVMIQHRPENSRAFILSNNQWIEIRPLSKAGIDLRQVKALSGIVYKFKDPEWQPVTLDSR